MSQPPTGNPKRDRYSEANLTAARVVLEQPERYAGVMVVWAKRGPEREAGREAQEIHSGETS